MSRSSTVAALAGALLLLPGAAWAHPAFNPNAAPAGAPTSSMLVVPHGCAPGGERPDGDAAGDTVSPTVLVSLQVRDGVTVEPAEVDGWATAVTDTEVTWTDAGGATTDVIQLPVTLTLSGETGDPLFVRAYQECESGDSFQWVGIPGDEARWPAVYVQVADEVGNEAPPADVMDDMDMGATDHDDMAMDDASATDDDMAMDDASATDDDMAMDDASSTDDDMAMDDASATDDDMAMDDASSTDDDMAMDDASTTDDDMAMDDASTTDEETADAVAADDDAAMTESADDGGLPAAVVVAVLAVIAVAAAALVRRGRAIGGDRRD